jgi:hypothetical protein
MLICQLHSCYELAHQSAMAVVLLTSVPTPTTAIAPGVEPVFRAKDQAIGYAETRACFRTGEIRVLDSTGKLERTISFNEADRKM